MTSGVASKYEASPGTLRLYRRQRTARHDLYRRHGNLIQRIHQHREGTFNGFSRRNRCHRLVWFECHETMKTAIQREKRIKEWQRNWKLTLIETTNPQWSDLSTGLGFAIVPQ